MATRNIYDETKLSETADRISGGAMLGTAIPALVDAIVLFWLFPGIDLWASRLFYLGSQDFVGNNFVFPEIARTLFLAMFVFACLITAVGLFIALLTRSSWFNLSVTKWMFIACCLAVGPGVIAHLCLEGHWGRARPVDVIEFGGQKTFTSPIHPSDQCERNCSFVPGEASMMYMIFFAAGLVFKTRARMLVILGLVFGSAAGLLRMAQGAHFLSDVLFAGILMAVTAATIRITFDSVMPAIRSIGRSERNPR